MYGTVAKMRIKAGMEQKMRELAASDSMTKIDGLVGTTVYKMDADPNVFMLAVVFTDKDAYVKNANSPEQNRRYEEMLAMLDGPPEWNDGEIVYPEK